jgi:hypothetical protein
MESRKRQAIPAAQNKTLYIKPEDEAIWDRAQALNPGRMSELVIRLLREYVDKEHAKKLRKQAGVGEFL